MTDKVSDGRRRAFMVKVTIPGYICEISEEEKKELEKLLFKFGKARRRAYSLRRKDFPYNAEVPSKTVGEHTR